jgi:ACT domain
VLSQSHDAPVIKRSHTVPTVRVVHVVVRVWLPDRPGALGHVAGRIGAAGGDVIGIEILEQGAGRAIDELIVELPSADLLALLVSEITQVDGVDVEDVRELTGPPGDPALRALATAAAMCESPGVQAVAAELVQGVADEVRADWAVVIDANAGDVFTGVGQRPDEAWLNAFVQGMMHAGPRAQSSADDVSWADLPGTSLVLMTGRAGRPLRAKERELLVLLARVAAARLIELQPGLRVASTASAP